MPSYFKNLSTYRIFLLCLLVVSAGISLFGVFNHREPSPMDTGRDHQTYDVLNQCSDDFGRYVATQESLAISLAARYETLEDGHDTGKIDQVLTSVLENTPPFIVGVGISRYGSESESRQVTYVAKNKQQTGDDLNTAILDREREWEASAREINIDRRMNWVLMPSSTADRSSRFATLLTVSLRGFATNSGDAIVKAECDWIADILRRLEEAGSKCPVCLTPGQEVLWLEKGRLVFNGDFPLEEDVERRTLVERVRRIADSDAIREQSDLLKSEILGSGWILLAPRPQADETVFASTPLSTIILLVAGGIIVLDMLVSTLAAQPRQIHEPIAEKVRAGSASEHFKTTGILGSAYNLLFRYRMINPEQERIESEMRIARKIQFSLVPDSFPVYSEWREFDLYSLLSPAREVGGDYYDFFMLDSNRMVLTVGDVSGKGFPAALYMAVCRTAFRTLAREAGNPGELLTRLNDLLVRDNKSGFYITMATFTVNLSSGECEYALAAHPAPLWYEKSADRAIFVDSPRETFIGMKAGLHYPVGHFRLMPGDTLLLYTDGVTEARNRKREELEYEGLKDIFLRNVGADCCQTLIAGMERSVHEFIGVLEQPDDLTLLAFRYWGPGGQKLLRKKEQKQARSEANAT